VSDWTPPSTASLADRGGINDCIQEVLELIVMPVKDPQIYAHTSVPPPCGVLLFAADLLALVRQTAIWSLKEILMNNALSGEEGSRSIKVKMEHFNQALDSLRPSVADQDRKRI
jgi:SpoVK/Ycf46/Vps4 family AAA+-type ATPase